MGKEKNQNDQIIINREETARDLRLFSNVVLGLSILGFAGANVVARRIPDSPRIRHMYSAIFAMWNGSAAAGAGAAMVANQEQGELENGLISSALASSVLGLFASIRGRNLFGVTSREYALFSLLFQGSSQTVEQVKAPDSPRKDISLVSGVSNCAAIASSIIAKRVISPQAITGFSQGAAVSWSVAALLTCIEYQQFNKGEKDPAKQLTLSIGAASAVASLYLRSPNFALTSLAATRPGKAAVETAGELGNSEFSVWRNFVRSKGNPPPSVGMAS